MMPEILWHTLIYGWVMVVAFAIWQFFYWLFRKIESKNRKLAWLVYFMQIPILVGIVFLVTKITGEVPYLVYIFLVIAPMLFAMMLLTIVFIYSYLAELERKGEIIVIERKND